MSDMPEEIHLHYYLAQGDGVVYDFCAPDAERATAYIRKDKYDKAIAALQNIRKRCFDDSEHGRYIDRVLK